MLGKDQTAKAVKDSLLRSEPIHDKARQDAAALAISYHDDNDEGTAMADDLRDYYGPRLYAGNATGLAKWIIKPKVCFNLLRPIASALCSLYEDPVRYTWEEKDQSWADLFATFRDDHVAAMADALLYSFLGGTTGVRPMVLERKGPVAYGLYTGDQMEATQDELDPALPAQLVLSWKNGGNGATTTTKHWWTAQGFDHTVDDVSILDEWEEKAYPGGRHQYGIIPVILVHNGRPRWSCFARPPMDLVQISRAINKKATDLDWRMTLAGDVLVTKGYAATTPPVVGAGAHLDLGDNGSAEFLGPDPRVPDAVSTINEYLAKALMSRRIPENAIMAQQTGESGIKVVADSSSLAGFRKQSANFVRPKEAQIIRLALYEKARSMGKRVRLEQIPAPSIKYTMPQAPMSADARNDWDRSHRLNITTPVDELMAREPSLSQPEAEERIKLNAEYNAQQGLTPMPGAFSGRQVVDEEDGTDLEAAGAGGDGAPPQAGAVGDVQKTALNGAQSDSLRETLMSIASGALAPEAAREQILLSFPDFDPERVDRMIKAIKVRPPAAPKPEPPDPEEPDNA